MKRPRGFTLLEVLLAVTLLAAGLALAFAALKSATAMTARGEAIAARSNHIRAVEQFLRRSLGDARPIAFGRDAQGEVLRFDGQAQRMRFVADLPDYLGVGGPHLYTLEASDESGGKRLQIGFAHLRGTAAVRPPDQLAEGLKEVRFAYRGLDRDGHLGDWQTQWPTASRLPLQVRIDITANDGAWPALIVTVPQAPALAGPMAIDMSRMSP